MERIYWSSVTVCCRGFGFDCQNSYMSGLVYDLKLRWDLRISLKEEWASFIFIIAKIKNKRQN